VWLLLGLVAVKAAAYRPRRAFAAVAAAELR